ncbi:MAG: hypothetical protein QG604_385 [Candidatus Dependentiae bacterium]|nr:hypothetical protein [Candidatus Dependentiae bacterium]
MHLLFALTLLLGSATYVSAGSAAPEEGSFFDRYVTKRTVTGTMIGLTTISSLDLFIRKREELNALLHGDGPLSQRLKKDPKARAALHRSIRTLTLLIATIVSALWPESTEMVTTPATSPSIKPIPEPIKVDSGADDEAIRRELDRQDAAFKAAVERGLRAREAKDKRAKKEKYRRALLASLSEANAQRDNADQAAREQALRDAAEAEDRRRAAEERAETERNAKAAADLAAREQALRDAAEAEDRRRAAEERAETERNAKAAADKAAREQALRDAKEAEERRKKEAAEKEKADRLAEKEAEAARVAADKEERRRKIENARKTKDARETVAREVEEQKRATASIEKEISDLDKAMTEASEEFKRLLSEPGRKRFAEGLGTRDIAYASIYHTGRLSANHTLPELTEQAKAPRELAERYDAMRDERYAKIFERATRMYNAIAEKRAALEAAYPHLKTTCIMDEGPEYVQARLYNDMLNEISREPVSIISGTSILLKHAEGYGERPAPASLYSGLYGKKRFVSGSSQKLAEALTNWLDKGRS